jgi:sulfur carrier protein
MKITLNGKENEAAPGTSVQAILETLGVKLEGVAVELNQEIVTRDRRSSTILKDGDKVEIIRIIGGG